jgi:FMN phosphatase YigB (HAD superfamily)
MHIAIDIDGTITDHPEFYRRLMHSWCEADYVVHILTARRERERPETLDLLGSLGFGQVLYEHDIKMHMYPHEYPWPWAEEEGVRIKQQHAAWKAEMCVKEGISVLYDDCPLNIAACVAVGVYAIHVPRMKGVVA